MIDKYHMTQEENIYYAKRNVVDYIWKSAKLEGLSVTFPDTEAIYNGITTNYIKVDEVVAINNLKHAWQFMFETINYPFDYIYLCKLHQLVGSNLVLDAGYIRKFNVAMGGTTWKPEMPVESDIKEKLSDLMNISNITERAITVMLYCMRTQMFADGNKRVSMLAGNQIMIANGKGIISVPIEKQEEFREKLLMFYESNNYGPMSNFVYDCCMDGFTPDRGKKEMIPDSNFFIKESRDREKTKNETMKKKTKTYR